MRLSELAIIPGSRKKRMRVGRGIGSGKGKQAGRGGKGQTARTGVRIKGFEGGQMPLHRRLPKRGFNNIFALELVEINLDRVQGAIDAGKLDAAGVVNAEALVKSGALRRSRDGVRLLGRGELRAKVAFEVHGASRSAVAAVEKAGGTVKILAPPRPVEEPKKDAKPEAKKETPKQAAPKQAKGEGKGDKAEAPKKERPKKESPKQEGPKREGQKQEPKEG
jgi:large subunit ribosomal protein L15